MSEAAVLVGCLFMLVAFIMTQNLSETLNCANFNATNSFAISTSCARFDFAVYTVMMGTLTALGVLGNAVSFVVLLRDRGRSTTSFLLQALAVADTLVLLTAVPLYVVPSITPFTGLLADYYAIYVSHMPVLWPIYLMPDSCHVLKEEVQTQEFWVQVQVHIPTSLPHTRRIRRPRQLLDPGFRILNKVPRTPQYTTMEMRFLPVLWPIYLMLDTFTTRYSLDRKPQITNGELARTLAHLPHAIHVHFNNL